MIFERTNDMRMRYLNGPMTFVEIIIVIYDWMHARVHEILMVAYIS